MRHRRALVWGALQLELDLFAVDHAQPLVHVAQADSDRQGLAQPLRGHPHPVVGHLDEGGAIAALGPQQDAPAADLAGEPVLDGVLDERLQDHARHEHVHGGRVDVLLDTKLRPEPDDLDIQVLVDRRQFLAQTDEVVLTAHETTEQARQAADDHPGRLGLGPHERRDGRQGVEEEVRVDLVGERRHTGRHEQLLLLLEAVLDACVVPDLDGSRHAHHRGEQDQGEVVGARGVDVEVEEPLRAEAVAEHLPKQLERDGSEQEHELPVDLEIAGEPPQPPGERREHERREVPNRFLRAELTQAAAGKAAADHERYRDPFAGSERRQAGHAPDDGARVGAANEADEEGAFEAEVGRVVAEQQAGRHAADQRKGQREGEHEAIPQVAPLEDEDVPEPPVAHEHRREQGHDGQLEDERRDQHLIGAEEARFHSDRL